MSDLELEIQSYHEALLLDEKSSVIVTGEARLFFRASTGEFTPPLGTTDEDLEGFRSEAGFLKIREGKFYVIQPEATTCQACNKAPHFHFQFTPLKHGET